MKEPIFQGMDLVKTFGETKVLQGINLELYGGDFTVVMGSSGSGKSTLLHILSGMDRSGGGQLFYYNGKQRQRETLKKRTGHSDGEMIDIAHASERDVICCEL